MTNYFICACMFLFFISMHVRSINCPLIFIKYHKIHAYCELWSFVFVLCLITWKKPHSFAASRIFWTISGRCCGEVTLERSITGISSADFEEDFFMVDRVSGGCMKILGMAVMPESVRPLTPNLESSNSFTSFIRS